MELGQHHQAGQAGVHLWCVFFSHTLESPSLHSNFNIAPEVVSVDRILGSPIPHSSDLISIRSGVTERFYFQLAAITGSRTFW